MWNNLLKITLVSYIWKRYRRTLIALPLLLLYFWLINLIHHDYLAYSELNDSQVGIGISFVIKWILIFIGIFIFVFIHFANGNRSARTDGTNGGPSIKPDKLDTASSSDAFDAIRKKDKLRSKAEVILDKKPK